MIQNYGKVLENVRQKDYTTYQLSGTIKKVIYPKSVNDLVDLLKYLKNENIKHKVLGNGSNVIFKGDYDGVIIKLDNLNNLEIKDETINVEAGYNLNKLSLITAKKNLSGLEFAAGIPGTIGGAIYMNAGAYKSDMNSIVLTATVLTDDYEIKSLTNEELKFAYRSSILKKQKLICLKKGNKKDILCQIKERQKQRIETQPLDRPSAGSVFRNPEGKYAGALIEKAGLKGTKIGGAEVSRKHANFIINSGKATGEDVIKLIELIKAQVKQKYDVILECEQEIIE